MIRTLLFFILTSFFTPAILQAQHIKKQFEHLRTENGLSDATVSSILQDSKGFMWFGTFKGLNRYDGYEMKVYSYGMGSEKGPNDNMISCLLEDHKGLLWVGFLNNGASVYDPKDETFQHYAGGWQEDLMVPSYSVNCMMEDDEQQLWIGASGGVSIISKDRKQFKKYYYEEGNPNTINGASVYDIVEDKWNRVWLATDNRKLSVYDKNTNKFSEVEYTHLPLKSIDDNVKKNLLIYNDTLLYVGSNSGGLAEYNLLTGEFTTYVTGEPGKGPSSNNIKDIEQVGNKLWLATDGAGLDVFDVTTKYFESHIHSKVDPLSLSTDVLWSLYKDREENIWLGAYLEGVDKYDPRKNFFRQISHIPCNENTLPNKPVLSLYYDKKGKLWAGTDWGGLHQQSEENENYFKHFDIDGKEIDGFAVDVAKTITEDSLGNFIVGTYSQGLRIIDKKTGKYYHMKRESNDDCLTTNNIWALYTDSKGITWVGTLGGGIAQFDPVNKECVKMDLDYLNAGQIHIYHIFEDAQSNIWFSTDNGVLKYERSTGKWTFDLMKGLIEKNHNFNYIRAVFEDKLRHIWMATAAGLVKYLPERNEFKVLTEENGIPQLPILNITSDSRGNLIIVSKNYISKMTLSDEEIVSFHISNNSFNYNSLAKNKRGEILIGGTDGITTFNPQMLSENEVAPPVYITGFDIFNVPQLPLDSASILNKSVLETETIELDYDQSVFNFNYCALNFTETERNQYAYKLSGFDTKWNYVGDRRIATYTNLDPGKYTFKVIASNNHGVWNKEGASINVIVNAPFWQSTWFRLLMFILFLVTLYILQRVRIMNVKKQFALESIQAEREKIQIQNTTLEKELDSTKSELTNITISHLHKNQSLQQVKQKLEELATNLGSTEKRKIRTIVKEINKESDDHDYWDKFEHQFNKSHDNFLERFKAEYPDLSKRELRICAYLRMDLENQEIATLMNVSVRTLETSRYRIRKKIGLEKRKSLTKMITRF
ncbi:two-component regulator propeller domain-containing protein [Flammeovirga sp. SJP92]|uniref:two-component regulator propeller domain-containing protein n=1 Tax=Flammeovirga sp. SJP92 TaxID=1775430 RepID=UPI000787F8EA|nr:two-component regulator propeller domain-containing protein [Flammeovirga sp. SJP92]KXX72338.1 hypothetical protein AVL50_01675 [Flammeovirga sp. SJP92]